MGLRSTIKKLRPGNYLRELSVVILGIFITLSATSYISGCSDRKEYRRIVGMVHAELVSNKRAIDQVIANMEHERTIEDYLYANRLQLDAIPYDTLYKYRHVHHIVEFRTFTSHALEVLKYSASVRSGGDVEIVRNIMQAYDYVGLCAKCIGIYYDTKNDFINELVKEVGIKHTDEIQLLKDQYNSVAMEWYVNITSSEALIEEAANYSRMIGESVRDLEEKYRIAVPQ